MEHCEIPNSVLEQKIASLLDFLVPYMPLARQNTVDFFPENLWQKCVPKGVSDDILKLTEEELWIFGSYPAADDLLIRFNTDHLDGRSIELRFHDDATLPQWRHLSLEAFLTDARRIYAGCLGPTVLTSLARLTSILHADDNGLLSIPYMMSPKKGHEVDIMADLCMKIAHSLQVSAVVDVGSGKGYLGTQLAFAHKINVLGVDCSESNTAGAVKRSVKIDKQWTHLVKKYGGPRGDLDNGSRHYQALTTFVTANTDFSRLVSENFAEVDVAQCCLMTGLHTCGNLAVHCLRMFSANDSVRAICNVGCCYDHVTEYTPPSDDCLDDVGFPMSAYLRRRGGIVLGKQVRGLAAQPLSRIAQGNMRPAKSLFWRAVLQQLLLDQCGGASCRDWVVGKVTNKCPDFLSYCRKAFERLQMQTLSGKLTDEEIMEYESRFVDREQTVYGFFQLRVVLSPLVEALILLDRLLYLREQEMVIQSHLTRLFDPVTSPRCFAIVAWKKPDTLTIQQECV